MMYGGLADDAELTICKSEMQTIRQALLQFKQDMGVLPGQGKLAYSQLKKNNKLTSYKGNERRKWFNSPANMTQLIVKPVDNDSATRHDWNIDTRRGWRGPYLSQDGNGLVNVGTGTDYASGTLVENVYAIGDAFDAHPVGSYFEWSNFAGTPFGEGTIHSRPYIFEDFDTSDARIVSMGPDGAYGNDDDLTLYLFK